MKTCVSERRPEVQKTNVKAKEEKAGRNQDRTKNLKEAKSNSDGSPPEEADSRSQKSWRKNCQIWEKTKPKNGNKWFGR